MSISAIRHALGALGRSSPRQRLLPDVRGSWLHSHSGSVQRRLERSLWDPLAMRGSVMVDRRTPTGWVPTGSVRLELNDEEAVRSVSQDLLARAFATTVGFFQEAAERLPAQAQMVEEYGCLLFRTEAMTVVAGLPAGLDPSVLASIRGLYPAASTVLFAPMEQLPSASHLSELGFTAPVPLPAMAASLGALPLSEAVPSGLQIQEVRDDAAYRSLATVQIETLGTDFGPRAGMKRLFGLESGSRVQHLLGQQDGEPVAAATLILDEDIVSLWGIGTLPAERGRGIGRALTLAACRAARGRGASLACLYSTPSGYGVYQGVGFRECGAVALPEAPPLAVGAP